jgi:hypothetical protein
MGHLLPVCLAESITDVYMSNREKCREAAEICRRRAQLGLHPSEWLRLAEEWDRMAEQADMLATWERSPNLRNQKRETYARRS